MKFKKSKKQEIEDGVDFNEVAPEAEPVADDETPSQPDSIPDAPAQAAEVAPKLKGKELISHLRTRK